jgi:NAD(P)-dependent dehydrogenase (short-subunit alcohol dehydrogenase family)
VRLDGKVAIVTGGSRGIGRATAELFAAEGATVYVADKDAPEPFEHEAIEWRHVDVTSLEDWTALVSEIVERHGKVDVLVNNAGLVGSYEPVDSIALDDWDHILRTNLWGVFYGMRSVIPTMRENGGGSIVNVSSIWGNVGAAGVSAYQASKGAVRTLSKNGAMSYVGDKVRVNSIHPGLVMTPMIAAQSEDVTAAVREATPMKRGAEPREIAYGILFLASDEASFVTGAELAIDGGYTAQ